MTVKDGDLIELGVENKWHRQKLLHDRFMAAEKAKKLYAEGMLPRRLEEIDLTLEEEPKALSQSTYLGELVHREVLTCLSKRGLVVNDETKVISETYDGALAALQQELMLLGLCEHACHWVIDQSAHVLGPDKTSVMLEAKQDLNEVLRCKKEARVAFIKVRAAADRVVTAMSQFRSSANSGFKHARK
mmetsp:Transcript_14268/g.39380  ORF Transcript_14268/g.39380 Transcript_14268/m.39380 type:complete len:188 (+) Transcript_14268:465-1028(+)